MNKIINTKSLHIYNSSKDRNVLFDGLLNSTGTYNLSDAITNYKFLLVVGQAYNASDKNINSMLIEVIEINLKSTNNEYLFSSNPNNRFLGFRFNSISTITINSISNYTGIKKIIGIEKINI